MGDERILLVGQAPSRDSDPSHPFRGRSGRRLAALFGLPLEEMHARVEAVNPLDRWPGKAGRGDAFPLAEARSAAAGIRARGKGRTILLVGKASASAFGGAPPEPFVVRDGVAWVPHTSGLCRFWNDPANVERAERFLRSLLT